MLHLCILFDRRFRCVSSYRGWRNCRTEALRALYTALVLPILDWSIARRPGHLVPALAAPLGTARKCAAPCDTDHLWHSGRLVRCTPGVGALGRRPPTRGDGPHGCAHCAGCSMDRFPGSRCTPQCGQAKELGSLSLSVGGPPATASSSLANWLWARDDQWLAPLFFLLLCVLVLFYPTESPVSCTVGGGLLVGAYA